MAALEERIGKRSAEIAAVSRSYRPWTDFPTERETWGSVTSEMAALRPSIEQILGLSRANRDEDARRAMAQLTNRFDVLNDDFAALTTINERGAAEAWARIGRIRKQLALTLLGAGAFELVGIALVTALTLRLDARYARATAEYFREIEERNRELDAFAGRVAHDLRGPLTAVKLAAARVAPKNQSLDRGIKRMEALIADLLALARAEVDTSGACDPCEVAAEVRDELAERIERDSGTLHVDAEHARARCSQTRLRQALTNLAENAIKYRRPDAAPEIAISGGVRDHEYVLRVADNGIGMTGDEARRAFDPLWRAPHARGVPGTGLGLAIVKRAVEASGGTVSIADSRVGRGTAFEIHLPLAE